VDDAKARIREFTSWRVFAPTAEDVLAAIDLHAQAKIGFWDAMVSYYEVYAYETRLLANCDAPAPTPILVRPKSQILLKLAPQAGFEPATLRLTGIVGDVISMVLQCLSSGWIIVIFGVRRLIVQ
jgi:hypothetical protein